MRLDRDMRVEAMNRGSRALDLGLADFGRPVDHLALQIRQRDRVVVDDAERPDPGGREIEQRRRAKSTGADHQHPRALERGLSGPADLTQHDVASITLELFGTEHDSPIRVKAVQPSFAKARRLCNDAFRAPHRTN